MATSATVDRDGYASPGSVPPEDPPGRGDLGDDISLVLERLWQRAIEYKLWLLGLLAASVVAAVFVTMLQTPLYSSTAQIEISRVDAGGGSAAEESEMLAEERDAQYYNTQYELLGSYAVAARVVEELNLTRDPAFAAAYDLGDAQITPETATSILLSDVTIEPIEISNLINISYSSPDAGLSAKIANAWAEVFLEMNYEKRFGNTALAREQLDDQLDEMRAKLEQSEAALNNYASNNEIIVLESTNDAGDTTRNTILATQLSALNDALATATTARIAAQSALAVGNTANEQSAVQQRIAETQAQIANLRTELGPQHPRVAALEAERASLTSSLQREGTAEVSARRAAYRQAALQESELRERYNAIRRQYLAQEGRGVRYGILEREVDTNRQIYDALLQRFNQLGVVGTGSNNMALVEPARPASSPYHPSLVQNLAIALALAVVLGAILVYLADLLDRTIRDPDDVKREFGLPVIGLIPKEKSGDVLEELQNRHSILSEAYAAACSTIQFSSRGRELKTIMLSSTRPEEGKTLSSVALAKSFALLGEKVVLIDLDLRRRGGSRLLQAGQEDVDLVSFLTGSSEAPNVSSLEDLGFDFIQSNSVPENPVALLASPKLGGLLETLGKNYDRVLIDGPPILGLADAIELTRYVDGIVYIIQANAGTNRSIRRALSRLREADANIIGSIVTKLDERNAAYGYGYGYGYGYSYAEKSA